MSSLQALLGKYKKASNPASGPEKRQKSDSKTDDLDNKRARPLSSKSTSSGLTRVLTAEDKDRIGYIDPSVTGSGDLATIGRRCKTDKVSHHGYYRFYPRYLEHMRSPQVSGGRGMIEIGIDESHSLATWLEYFPKAFIYGIDIGVELDGERHRIFQVRQRHEL
jgi:hypothetical protein